MSNLEYNGNPDLAKKTRHDLVNTLLKHDKKPRSNLTYSQRKGLKTFKQRDNVSAAPFDKGKGFAVEKTEKYKEKTIAAMDNVTPNVPDKTKELQKNINSALNKLVEENKLTQNEAKI